MSLLPPHRNVLPLVSFKKTDSYTLLALPLATGGDTLRLMQERGLAGLPEADARGLFVQLVAAVKHMHAHGVVHRDIKCENILLAGARHRQLVLADMGFATRYEAGKAALDEPWGSLHYSSPEIVAQTVYEGPEVDVWSMGVVLYAWCTGRLPFGGSEQDTALRILSASYQTPSSLSPPLAELIRRMLTADPAKRATLAEIAAHPWLRDADEAVPVLVPRHASTAAVVTPPEVVAAVAAAESRQRRYSVDGLTERPNKAAQLLRRIFRK